MGTSVPLHYYVLPIEKKGKINFYAVVTDTWADGRKNGAPITRGIHKTEEGAEKLAAEWNKAQPTMQPTGPPSPTRKKK